MTTPLEGIRVLDLTRILAGPTATQLLGDLGAEIIKVERPDSGDDTRKWGPPYVKDANGQDTTESAYYLAINRNKKSITLDIAKPEGQKLARKLISNCDVFIENFKVGDMAKYALAYEDLKEEFPHLIYCSITGFGQTGPYAPRAGYDFLAQGLGGIMSVTGDPKTAPMKVGVAITDITCGLYAVIAILGALHHQKKTGKGQYIDLALLDTQVSWLANIGLNYLTSGEIPQRMGNEHPNIVPYSVVPSADGYFILAIGNDGQFQKFCLFADRADWAVDPRFSSNPARVRHRVELYRMIEEVTRQRTQKVWIDGLTKLGVPVGPVNNMEQVFSDPQVLHREMKITMPHSLAASGQVDLIGNPIKFSETKIGYQLPPPICGQHTEEIFKNLLCLGEDELKKLREQDII